MPAPVLNASAQMLCPHGGMVQIIPSNTRFMVGGAPALVQTDTYVVAGCVFTVGLKPQPCVQVRWLMGAARLKVNGTPVLTQTSIGLCISADMIPAGPPNIIFAGQTRLTAD